MDTSLAQEETSFSSPLDEDAAAASVLQAAIMHSPHAIKAAEAAAEASAHHASGFLPIPPKIQAFVKAAFPAELTGARKLVRYHLDVDFMTPRQVRLFFPFPFPFLSCRCLSH